MPVVICMPDDANQQEALYGMVRMLGPGQSRTNVVKKGTCSVMQRQRQIKA